MNKRLVATIMKHKKNIKDGTFLDCYNQTIYNKWGGCISTRIDASNNYFVVVKDERRNTNDK